MKSEKPWALIGALLIAMLTCVPYFYGTVVQGARASLGWFSGYTFNATDHCVYLSWMRQAADGGFFQRNLFTTDPQSGHQFNVFYLVLGKIAWVTHLQPITVYHVSRPLLVIGLLLSIHWLLRMWLPEGGIRKCALASVAVSAGLGWLPGFWERPILAGPADTWQPEAISFLSMYLFPLFLISQILMVGVIGFLYKADQSNHRKYAVYAGLCGLVLGNIHTYDILTLSLVWVAYLVYRTITRRGDLKRIWLNGLLAGLIAAPSTAYVALMLKTETVFRERAEVLTLTPSPLLYLQGFGLLVPMALAGWLTWKRRQSEAHSDQSATDSGSGLYLLGIWTIFNFAAAYIPTTFQRKMMMGVHIPLSILAGVALWNCSRGLSGRVRIAVVGMVLCLLSLTNVRFLLRDMDALPLNQPGVRSYLYRGEMASLQWIREHAAPGDAIQPLPWIAADERGGVGFFDTSVACYAPGITGHAVNAGHWGETPQFGKTMNKWVKFIRPDTDDAYRRELVQQTGVKYILFSQKHQETPNTTLEEATLATMRLHPPAFLRLVTEASNEDTDVYEVSS